MEQAIIKTSILISIFLLTACSSLSIKNNGNSQQNLATLYDYQLVNRILKELLSLKRLFLSFKNNVYKFHVSSQILVYNKVILKI